MGGERAATTRRREAGLICARCHSELRTLAPPPTRRGYGRRERLCERCDPPTLRINIHVMRSEWSVTFSDDHTLAPQRPRIGPWLLLDSAAQLDVILRWGRVYGREAEGVQRDLDRWGVGSTDLRLTPHERLGLIARGRGCPWNGYELIRLRAAGRMPLRARFRTFKD